jgi:hypothetical protein
MGATGRKVRIVLHRRIIVLARQEAGRSGPARRVRRRLAGRFASGADWLNVSGMTAIMDTPALAAPGCDGRATPLARLRASLRRVTVRDMAVAAFIVLAASAVVHAEQRIQDWIPDVLTFPADAEVMSDRAIGSSIRMFSIATSVDVDALFAEWEESLGTNGYPVTQGQEELLDRSIEFSGPGISNAKIIVAPVTDDGRSIIEFDATLD